MNCFVVLMGPVPWFGVEQELIVGNVMSKNGKDRNGNLKELNLLLRCHISLSKP